MMLENIGLELAAASQEPQGRCRVPVQTYLQWRRLWTLDGIRGIGYGQSFCDHFHIRDYILSRLRSVSIADRHIRTYYLDARPIRPRDSKQDL